MAQPEIIGIAISNDVRTVRMAGVANGVDDTRIAARPHTPDGDAIAPLGKIPVVRHGDVRLCGSKAVCATADARA